jgi:CTP synthase
MEFDPATPYPLLVPVACPVDDRPGGGPRLSGQLNIQVSPGSLAGRVYGRADAVEAFSCNYELNPEYRKTLEKAGMKVSGTTPEGGVRIIELPGHTFFIGTGFVPQMSSGPGRPHPLIAAFLKAALKDR